MYDYLSMFKEPDCYAVKFTFVKEQPRKMAEFIKGYATEYLDEEVTVSGHVWAHILVLAFKDWDISFEPTFMDIIPTETSVTFYFNDFIEGPEEKLDQIEEFQNMIVNLVESEDEMEGFLDEYGAEVVWDESMPFLF